jgi:hypothetical protein
MKTRSMTKKIQESTIMRELPVEIDFDGAIAAWNMNKKKLGDCTYKYICMHCTINGRKCGKTPLAGKNYCKSHSK